LAVQDDEKIDYDLETTPLEIKTDSMIGSEDKMRIGLHNSHGNNPVGFYFKFTSPPQYLVWLCNSSYTNFPTNMPAAIDKIWRLTLTRTSGNRLVIHCNEKEVLNILMSDSTCSERNWSAYWTRKVTKIEFDSKDTASDFYRPTSKINTEII
jgi:hypothetical protein